jgi:hypothetical protein
MMSAMLRPSSRPRRARVAILLMSLAASCARGVQPDAASTTDASPTDTGARNDAAPSGPAARRGSEIVSSGGLLRSPHFQMVFTLGQSTTNQQPVHSPNQRLQGGFVGTTAGAH